MVFLAFSALISAASTAMQRQIPQHPAARGSLLATSLCFVALPGLPDGCARLQHIAASTSGLHARISHLGGVRLGG